MREFEKTVDGAWVLLISGRRWIISIVVVVFIISSLLYVTMNSGIQLVTTIPKVFQEQKIHHVYKNGFTSIICEQEHINNPVIHDDQALYVLNAATNEFKKFYINSVAGELVIRQNIMSAKSRSKPYFQVVKVPNGDYETIIHDGKVKIRIQYMYLDEQSSLLEYDLKTRKTNLISYTLVGK